MRISIYVLAAALTTFGLTFLLSDGWVWLAGVPALISVSVLILWWNSLFTEHRDAVKNDVYSVELPKKPKSAKAAAPDAYRVRQLATYALIKTRRSRYLSLGDSVIAGLVAFGISSLLLAGGTFVVHELTAPAAAIKTEFLSSVPGNWADSYTASSDIILSLDRQRSQNVIAERGDQLITVHERDVSNVGTRTVELVPYTLLNDVRSATAIPQPNQPYVAFGYLAVIVSAFLGMFLLFFYLCGGLRGTRVPALDKWLKKRRSTDAKTVVHSTYDLLLKTPLVDEKYWAWRAALATVPVVGFIVFTFLFIIPVIQESEAAPVQAWEQVAEDYGLAPGTDLARPTYAEGLSNCVLPSCKNAEVVLQNGDVVQVHIALRPTETLIYLESE